jgi:hypothetical protein
MKKLALFCGMAALGMCAMNAGATIPEYYESANITGTLNVQESDDKTTTVSFNNKDLLTLIADEFGSLPTGAQLAIYDGLAYDGMSPGDYVYFYILYPNGTEYSTIGTVSYNEFFSDSYELYFIPNNDSFATDRVEKYNGSDSYTSFIDQSELIYVSGNGDYYFYLWGMTKDNVNFTHYPYSENFTMTMGQGAFYLPNLIDVGDEYGVMTGTFSGSGSKVQEPWDY